MATVLPKFIVVVYDTGDDRLPHLRPALDVSTAAMIATNAAHHERRPTVRVFSCVEDAVPPFAELSQIVQEIELGDTQRVILSLIRGAVELLCRLPTYQATLHQVMMLRGPDGMPCAVCGRTSGVAHKLNCAIRGGLKQG